MRPDHDHVSLALVRIMSCALVLMTLVAGCYNPSFEEGIVCSEAQTCPPGLTCEVATNICRADVSDQDGGSDALDACAVGGVDPCAPFGTCSGTADDYVCACQPEAEYDGTTCVVGVVGSDTNPRTWVDGTVATSCQVYRYPALPYAYQGDIGDGMYRIDGPDGPVLVYCDMSTDGGGWTGVDPLAAVGLGGIARAAHSVGVTTCQVDQDGFFEGRYGVNTTLSELACQYDIGLGFAIDTVRVDVIDPTSVVRMESLAVAGNVTDIADHLGLPWGTILNAAGDVMIGTPSHGTGVLSLGNALNAPMSYGPAAIASWPVSGTQTTTRDNILRMQYEETGTQGEGMRWIAGRIFVRDSTTLPP